MTALHIVLELSFCRETEIPKDLGTLGKTYRGKTLGGRGKIKWNAFLLFAEHTSS